MHVPMHTHTPLESQTEGQCSMIPHAIGFAEQLSPHSQELVSRLQNGINTPGHDRLEQLGVPPHGAEPPPVAPVPPDAPAPSELPPDPDAQAVPHAVPPNPRPPSPAAVPPTDVLPAKVELTESSVLPPQANAKNPTKKSNRMTRFWIPIWASQVCILPTNTRAARVKITSSGFSVNGEFA